MDKLCNLVILKNKQAKFSSIHKKLVYNILVIYLFYLAIVQLLSNSLNKVDIDLRNNLYN